MYCLSSRGTNFSAGTSLKKVHVCDRVHWFSIGGGVFDEDYHIMSDVEFSDGMLESDDDEEDKEEDDDDDDENVNEYDCDYDYEYDYYDDDEEEEEEEESEEGDSDDCDEDDG